MLQALVALFCAVLAWAALAELDIVAVAEGKLVPASYLQVAQPAEAGIVKEILVREGERVSAGQVLMRMDEVLSEADFNALTYEFQTRRLTLRRIDAQLAGRQLARQRDDPPGLFTQLQAQHDANVRAYESALAQERATLDKARYDLAAASEVKAKLEQVLPHYRAQEQAFEALMQEGFAGKLAASDKARERIEKEQELRTQEALIQSAAATIVQSEKRLAQIGADYRRQLQVERVETATQSEKLRQELAKHRHRAGRLELRAPQDAIVKDLATHTAGTVTTPGTILMTLVPANEPLQVEAAIRNEDVGFIAPGQRAKVKLAAYPFQKYGMIEGEVAHVGPDSIEATGADAATRQRGAAGGGLTYKALVSLDAQTLVPPQGEPLGLTPGMQVVAEIHQGRRTVLEYLLSPVQKVAQEAGRER